MATLEVKNLHVEIEDEERKTKKEILKGVNLEMKTGEIHAIMGPNGTGKSTLSQTIMGQSNYHSFFLSMGKCLERKKVQVPFYMFLVTLKSQKSHTPLILDHTALTVLTPLCSVHT